MRRRVQLFSLFLATAAGMLVAGLWSAQLLVLWSVSLLCCAPLTSCGRRMLRERRLWVLTLTCLAGGSRAGVYFSHNEAHGNLPSLCLRGDAYVVEVGRVRARNHRRTDAYVDLVACRKSGWWFVIPKPTEVRLTATGMLDLLEGGRYLLTGKWQRDFAMAPEPLGPRWPREKPRRSIKLRRADDLVLLGGDKGESWSDLVRWRLTRDIEAHSSEPALQEALLLGEGSAVDTETRDIFTSAGLSHLLAVSGTHVGALALVLSAIFTLTLGVAFYRWRPNVDFGKVRLVLLALGGVALVVLSNGTPSATRAALMVGEMAMARWLSRRPDPWSIVGTAGMVDLWLRPGDVFKASFQLSYLAVCGIVALYRPLVGAVTRVGLQAKGRGPWRWVVRASSVSLSASLATWPLVLLRFGRFALIAPLSSLIGIPVLAFLVMPALSLSALLWPLSNSAFSVTVGLADRAVGVLVSLARVFASMDPGIGVPDASVGVLETVVLGLVGPAVALRFCPRRAGFVCLVLVVAALVLSRTGGARGGMLEVRFFDVGKGDAALVRCPMGQEFLVDVGDRGYGGEVVVRKLGSLGIDRLDGVVLTHGDSDHAGGLADVLSRTRAEWVAFPCEAMDDGLRTSARVAAERGAEVRCLSRGSTIVPGCGAQTTVLWPPSSVTAPGNDASLVWRLEYGRSTFLFTGDIGSSVEARLAADPRSVRADVLQLPHHGSARSSSTSFLRAVAPVVGVATGQTGIERKGIADQVLWRLRQSGIPALHPPPGGEIVARTDGRYIYLVVTSQ